MKSSHFIGVDIGTQGTRVALVDAQGRLRGSCEHGFALNNQSLQEQSPEQWWEVCRQSLGQLLAKANSELRSSITAVAVTSTSGTVIPLDKNHHPLHGAIMYSDKRSRKQAELCRRAAEDAGQHGYTGYNSSSGLPKMVWFVQNFPAQATRISSWSHAADYITAKLSGQWRITDYTCALKSGYDIRKKCWPEYLSERLPLDMEWFPKVVPAGSPVGHLQSDLAEEFGLSEIVVVAGMTDGCASQLAAGAVEPGDWNTTIGTTLVIKGVTEKPIEDPQKRLYNHRHPMGWWLPGGASNTGADWVTREYSDDLQSLNKQAEALLPTGHLSYPLRRQGERFPFIAPQARGFAPDGLSRCEHFAANLEGVAYIERYAFDVIKELSGEEVKAVYTAGGGSKNEVWLKIRSNVLGLPVCRMSHITGAVGAAILAASQTHYSMITEAVSEMTQMDKKVNPAPALVRKYADNYHRFLDKLEAKGYINQEEQHA